MVDLPEPAKDLKTNKRFPPSLRGTIYEAMIEALSDELSVYRSAVYLQKTSFYDVDLMSIARMLELSNTFGVPFVSFVKDDTVFLQEEIRAIPFKIYYKGTPTLYKSFIYALDRYGEMFIYVYRDDVKNIVRSMKEPFDDAYMTPLNLPFRHRSFGNFSGGIENWLKLDTNRFLDAGDASWTLDTSSTEITTNHFGLEYFIDRVIRRKDKNIVTGVEKENDYLMTKEYLLCIDKNIEFARRTKEVPHLGFQLSIQSDNSGLCNSYDLSSEYSVPSLKLKVVTRPDFFDLVATSHDIARLDLGIGKRAVASVQNPSIPFPDSLALKICSVPILFNDQLENSYFIGAVGEYLGQSLNEFLVLDGAEFDGVLQNFDFTLPFPPVQRGSILLEFHLPLGKVLPVRDDGRGNLLSVNGKGTIDYRTGNCHLSTNFDCFQTDLIEKLIIPGDELDYNDVLNSEIPFNDVMASELSWNITKFMHFTHTLKEGASAVPGSILLVFYYGEGGSQRTYVIGDDGQGHFIHSLIQSGTVDYTDRTIDIMFIRPIIDPLLKPFTCKYGFPVDLVLPAGTKLIARSFLTQQSVCITEAGFRSKDGDLLNYAVFPPMEFDSNAYHLNFMILVRKLLSQ